MTMEDKRGENIGEAVMTLQSFVGMLLAIAVGAIAATIILPQWLPGLSASILGPEPTFYWYLSRGTAFVSFALLWISMALGLIISNKMARLWPGGPVAFDLHQYTSILGLGLAVFHGLILMGDQYISYSLVQVLTPFASSYEPYWVGLGQIGIYLWLLVVLSFYVRKTIGRKLWRTLHFVSFLSFILALIHGVSSGTDSGTLWAMRLYWFAGGSLLFLTLYRVLVNPKLFPKAAKVSLEG
jgi:predicted ferric reductase